VEERGEDESRAFKTTYVIFLLIYTSQILFGSGCRGCGVANRKRVVLTGLEFVFGPLRISD
jgi:hypothetical protein